MPECNDNGCPSLIRTPPKLKSTERKIDNTRKVESISSLREVGMFGHNFPKLTTTAQNNRITIKINDKTYSGKLLNIFLTI